MSHTTVPGADFLVEIGTEELPPKALLSLIEAFRESIVKQLADSGLGFAGVQTFATPRRLAVMVESLDQQAPSKEVIAWGPPTKVAFDESGQPSRAAEAFASKNGIALDVLLEYVENDGKQDKLCYRATEQGLSSTVLLPGIIETALAALPIPKRMRWGAQREEFVRPVHWVVMLLGPDVITATIMGLATGNTSQGHRFHGPGEVAINSPGSYVDDLRAAFVIADFDERRERIRNGIQSCAESAGGTAVIDEDLLNEVTALNEWPVSLAGEFDKRFLEVPSEALISSMKEHQKYFHLVDDRDQLLPLFVTVANIDSKDPSQVIRGNERVIRPRLADADFFYKTDLKTSLAERRESLKNIVFQSRLGSVFDKTERVARLSIALAATVGADPEKAQRAAELSKSDLVSDMVGEFDKLQGIMGRYYAINDGEDREVAEALYEQYLPKFAGDKIPATAIGATLALADRLDTLAGIFGIGQKPSGSRDPFALRRASLGVLRIVVEKEIDLDLREALSLAIKQHGDLAATETLCEEVLTYMLDRFKSWYEDEKIASEVFQSVAAKQLSKPLDIHQRVQAVHAFSQLPEAAALASANKRVSNILSKQSAIDTSLSINPALLEAGAEQTLAADLSVLADKVEPLLRERRYTDALTKLAQLQKPVDQFFDDVMVMTDDEAVRNNRLNLLHKLRSLFLEVADISLLAPSK
ncbi:MAG: glycine--tRNA ligase subunit beta [Pseudomonadales bacterium]|nr:glycine--tRNA ligase subunit beta [Pseudomonadales bacterium]MCP5302383.1 glycine--tRNA ligase subunit beta [Pseudomonadales bacterium]